MRRWLGVTVSEALCDCVLVRVWLGDCDWLGERVALRVCVCVRDRVPLLVAVSLSVTDWLGDADPLGEPEPVALPDSEEDWLGVRVILRVPVPERVAVRDRL